MSLSNNIEQWIPKGRKTLEHFRTSSTQITGDPRKSRRVRKR